MDSLPYEIVLSLLDCCDDRSFISLLCSCREIHGLLSREEVEKRLLESRSLESLIRAKKFKAAKKKMEHCAERVSQFFVSKTVDTLELKFLAREGMIKFTDIYLFVITNNVPGFIFCLYSFFDEGKNFQTLCFTASVCRKLKRSNMLEEISAHAGPYGLLTDWSLKNT